MKEATDALTHQARDSPQAHLSEMVRLHRRFIRSAIHQQFRTHRILEPLQPLFDKGVTLTHQLSELEPKQGKPLLARALTDRAMLFATARLYAPTALPDYRKAVELLR